VNYSYTLFENFLFCTAIYGIYEPTTLVYYWPIQVQGWQDGSLYVNFAWTTRALRSQISEWMTPAETTFLQLADAQYNRRICQ
jgi:hypothetical protein